MERTPKGPCDGHGSSKIVAEAGVLMIQATALAESDTAAAKVMMKRMGQTDRFVFFQLPTGMKTADVVGDVAGEKTVFPALDFLL